MPDWQPNWSDVAFDHAAVAAGAEDCRAAALAIEAAVDAHARAADVARTDFSGRARQEFDAGGDRFARDAARLVAELRATAAALEGAADDARTEQARRERERERWRAERDRERALERADT
jgi:uncharacterized protein YukE